MSQQQQQENADLNRSNATSTSDLNNVTTNKRTLAPMIGMAFAGTTIVGTLVLTAPFVLQYVRSPLPYMATPKDKVKKALQFVEQRQRQKYCRPTAGGEINSNHNHTNDQELPAQIRHWHFVDLGSGDGEAVYQALQLRGNNCCSKATGIELNFTLWVMSQLRRWLFWTSQERQRCHFLWKDLFTYNLQTANAVMIFGVKPLMIPISQKLAQECKPGTHILSYRFPVPLRKVEDSNNHSNNSDVEGENTVSQINNNIDGEDDKPLLLNAKLVYDEEEMRIYECVATTCNRSNKESSSSTA